MATEDRTQAGGGNPAGQPSALYNWISVVGLGLFVLGVGGSLTLFGVDLLVTNAPAYLGILYIPTLMMVVPGIILLPLGYVLAKRKRARGEELALPLQISIDLTIARHRYLLMGLFVGTVAGVAALAIGSFQAFRAMESDTFCGQLCHSVMAPEAIAHGETVHARVPCVACHIGSGVDYYIHSKTAGMRRMLAMIVGSVQRPIPTPIKDLRPARETCEECHWSTRMIGYKEKVHTYFVSGEKSPEHKMRMLIKIGGADSTYMKGFGIHYHMMAANKVEYVARDRQRQEIAWVRLTHSDGTVREFANSELPLTDEEKKTLPVRRMDCLDCHNRPAHNFKSPVDAVDEALAAGQLSRRLPFIKVQAVKALDGKYPTTAAAMEGIAERLTNFYKEEHPEVLEKQADAVKETINDLRGIYKSSFFPEMKASWSAYPNNIGHRDWPGCFRCHTDQMKSVSDGKPVFTDCTKCHLILAQDAQVEKGGVVDFTKGKPFDHPGYGDTIREYTKCIDCHTGGADLY